MLSSTFPHETFLPSILWQILFYPFPLLFPEQSDVILRSSESPHTLLTKFNCFRRSMQLMRGSFLWIFPMNLSYESFLWTFPMNLSYEPFLWTFPMNLSCESFLWIFPLNLSCDTKRFFVVCCEASIKNESWRVARIVIWKMSRIERQVTK